MGSNVDRRPVHNGKKNRGARTFRPGRRHGDSQHPMRGEAVLIVGAGRREVKTMPAMLITLEPIKAPTKAVAARIRLALHEEQYQWPDVDPPHGPNNEECEISLDKQDDAEWKRRQRNHDPRQSPPTYRILTLYVHDMGTHRRVTMNLHTEEGRPMATMIEDMLRQEQWLDDAPAAQDDQAPAGVASEGEAKTAPRRRGRHTDPWNAAAIQRLLDDVPEDEVRATWRKEFPDLELNATEESALWNKNVISKPALKDWRKKYRKK